MRRYLPAYLIGLISLIAAAESSGRSQSSDVHPVGFDSIREEAWLKEAVAKLQLEHMKELAPISEEFDIQRYGIDLEVFPEDSLIAGSVRVAAEVVAPAETLWLHMNSSWLFVDSIVGQASGWQHADDLLGLAATVPYEAGETIELTIHYHGSPEHTFRNHALFGSHQGTPLIMALGAARTWWPSRDQPDDKADTVTISIIVPQPFLVVSNGLLASEEVLSERRARYRWIEGYPIATFSVFFVAMEYDIETDWYVSAEGDSTPIYYYLYPGYSDPENAFAATVPALEVFSLLFGSYPFAEEKYASAMAPIGGGLGFQTCPVMGAALQDFLTRHEISHQWWGGMIGLASFKHVWLVEGFATYSEALWQEVVNGVGAYRDCMWGMTYYGPGTIYVEDPAPDWIFDMWLVYAKAAYVLHMLRHMVGDNLFFDALLHYRELFEYSTAVTEDFRHAVEDIWGNDLSWFFEQWIYWEYYPSYEYGWTCTERHQPGWLTTIVIRQIQTNTGLFKMPVDLKLTLVDGSEETHVVWVERTFADSFYFETDLQVTGIELDPDNWVLCEKREVSLDALDHPAITDVLTIEGPWPNPASGQARLIVRPPSSGCVSLYDLGGRLVLRENVAPESDEVVLPLNSNRLLAGTYILRFTSPCGLVQRKLIVRE